MALLGLAVALSSQGAATPALTMLAKDGRRSIPIALVSDQELVSLDDLAAAFQLTVHEEAQGAITVSYKGKTIVLTADQSLASVSGRLVSLPAPTTRSGRRWLVPVEFISSALALIYDVKLDLRKPSRLLVVGDVRVPRIAVRFDSLGASGRLTIDATPRANSTIAQDGNQLTIKFDADTLDAPNPPFTSPTPQSLVQAVRLADATTLIVELGPRFAGFRSTSEPVDTTMRLTIDIASAQTDMPTPAPPTATAQPAPDALASLAPTAFTIRTIAIDPGHGGNDEGVKGAAGAKEKDVALTVARRLKAAIEGRLGIRVLLTRDDDRNVAIDERAAIANNNKADLFISLHANASRRPATSGATILSAGFEEDAAKAAASGGADRVPTFGGGLRDIELVLWDFAQTRHLDESIAFATVLEQQFHDRVPTSAHATERAPLRVLESANMPAVLVEMGFLTNAQQEKLLVSDAFQNAFVQSVYEAVVKYRDSLSAGGTR